MPLPNSLPSEAREHVLALCLAVSAEPAPPPAEQEHLFAELDELLFGVDEEFTRWILEHPQFQPRKQRLHEVRAEYEYDRERDLARALVAAGDESPLASFRSAGWYQEAHKFELEALAPYAPQRLLVVGAGPFPTTALSFMRAHPGASVACIELRAEAFTLATQVARISHCEGLQVIHGDALNLEDFSDYDCVIVGTVVGVSEAEKHRVVAHFLKFVPASTLLVLRTAIGPGRIVYPCVDLNQLAGIEYRILTNPPQETFTMIITDRADRHGRPN